MALKHANELLVYFFKYKRKGGNVPIPRKTLSRAIDDFGENTFELYSKDFSVQEMMNDSNNA